MALPLFVLDAHLGKLARHLRTIGIDALWSESMSELPDERLMEIAAAEGRILLTRDRELFGRMDPARARYVDATDPAHQIRDIVEAFGLRELVESARGFLTRCLECNAMILPVKPHQVAERIPGRLMLEHEKFFLCPRCERVYWEGSHVERMRRWMARLLQPMDS